MSNHMLADCPDAVRAYFGLTTGDDRTAAIVGFADTARVIDDGHDYQGTSAIRAWLDRAASEYTYTTTPLATRTDAATGETIVTCRLEGTFPGSPVDLDYQFRLDDAQRISNLQIAVNPGA